MTSSIRFDGRVAIVTGAGNGLGRSHAMELAKRGASVVINDLGGSVDGTGSSASAAEKVAEEINASGGNAIANGANVTKPDEVNAMVDAAMSKWGRVDILINNAGILRDKSFGKMTLEDFQLVVDVHLMGAATCSKAVWQIMRDQGYGRIMMTSSPSGLYGNFGQANYAAAKMGVVGLMNTLHMEGAKYNIRVNALAPTAATRMTEGLPGMTPELLGQMRPEAITAGVVYLVSEDSPARCILSCAGGGYAVTLIEETEGTWLPPEQQTPEGVAANFGAITAREGLKSYEGAFGPTMKFVGKIKA